MTRDDIIRTAQKAGLTDPDLGECVTDYGDATEGVLRFAELIIAAEREACAKVCEAEAEKWEGKDGPVCFEARLCSHAIRARGEK